MSIFVSLFCQRMQKYILDSRLSAAAGFVPAGARLADIGSDHAYLPIQLVLSGVAECALASDINEGPVRAARKNIEEFGVGDRVRCMCSDGLCGVEDFAPDCITVLGMGGELIVRILHAAPWIRAEGIRLILQPMTHSEAVSRYLCSEGFKITDETIVCDGTRDDRIYRIIVAEFDGIKRELNDAEHYIGKKNIETRVQGTNEYASRLMSALRVRIDGRRVGGLDCTDDERLLRSLEEIFI